MKKNLITNNELPNALNIRIESSAQGDKSGVDLSDEAEMKIIENRYKDTEYFKDLNELIGIIVHKIRNPLAGISAAAEILMTKTEKNEANDKLFMMIFKKIDRLESTAKNLFMTFSKISNMKTIPRFKRDYKKID
ncbi:MAG: hypothetical protein HOI47_16595 [Candidatus Scalindua sp.]|jgi:nitrogen-specific signal transduction histidine kinase|nr:hypothetical protein [Candidatus Scalindua sp.]